MPHEEILSEEQRKLFSLLTKFRRDFCLCGGTAIALILGHRESIDFDLFTLAPLRKDVLQKELRTFDPYFSVLVDSESEYTVVVKRVKITFLSYPFTFSCPIETEFSCLPDLLTLAAMKAYTLSRRSKWKDYVDLYFILEEHHSLAEICARAETMFGGEFNEKVFRAALAYFDDVDTSEQVIFRPSREVSDETIREALIGFATA